MINPLIHEKLVQNLPINWEQREALRQKGQFWTPDWVSEAMLEWVLSSSEDLFDPAIGSGAFFRAAKRYAWKRHKKINFFGCELYAEEIDKACDFGLSKSDFEKCFIGDFLKLKFDRKFSGIIANPPYIRHHRLDADYKWFLKRFSEEVLGISIDARSGLHVYFLIKALTLLDEGGKLAFIVPSDICEGKFASGLWQWIAERFCIHAAVTFSSDASPFRKVDTNPLVLFISKTAPHSKFWWAQAKCYETNRLYSWVAQGFGTEYGLELDSFERNLDEGLKTGLTRPPIAPNLHKESLELGTLFKVMRGVATGCNEFFFLNSTQIKEFKLPNEAFIRAIGRTRDVATNIIEQTDLDNLDNNSVPTYLLYLNSIKQNAFTESIENYLKIGVNLGLPNRALIKQRSVWYKMETRQPPPWLFAYLGRRNCRFIQNKANVIPLTGFLCVYERHPGQISPEILNNILNDPLTIQNLALVAKSYGGGALKVEPRQLEKLPIPLAVIRKHGLEKDFINPLQFFV